MMPNYNSLIQFDLELYEIYRTGYNPVENVKNFWEQYSLSTVYEYIVALQTYVSNEEKVNLQLSEFSVHLLRVLIAYLMIHISEMDLRKVSISVDPNKEELEIFKKIYDFFQRVTPSNPNP
ncbi:MULTISPECIES: hypothetical protein [Sphingobacterium]|jgi:hypothetical protein|uniref:hypothetical protein n=1 Tax=Sphingobacterium TaxID=28453 RepID=UPI0012FDD2B5|nr:MULTISPECIES: hypothetical protein [Sphingobacterium]